MSCRRASAAFVARRSLAEGAAILAKSSASASFES
jgi:hypothetical protein